MNEATKAGFLLEEFKIICGEKDGSVILNTEFDRKKDELESLQ